ncbi:MAG: Tad domain-containing protein [Candidatus Firestonebacteria bacterium]
MKKQKGQIVVFVLLFIPVLLVILAFVLATGKMVYYRIKLQNATDAAAYTAALWQARGLNGIADLNWALVAAAGGDMAKFLLLDFDFELVRIIQKVQDGAKKSFPGLAGLAAGMNFSSNIDKSIFEPLPPRIGMFSLRVRRHNMHLLKIEIPTFMEKDSPMFWVKQNETGPFIRFMSHRKDEGIPFGGCILNLGIPIMTAISQAMPYRENDEYLDIGYLGGLWDPNFYAKLTPISGKIPWLNGIIFH